MVGKRVLYWRGCDREGIIQSVNLNNDTFTIMDEDGTHEHVFAHNIERALDQ